MAWSLLRIIISLGEATEEAIRRARSAQAEGEEGAGGGEGAAGGDSPHWGGGDEGGVATGTAGPQDGEEGPVEGPRRPRRRDARASFRANREATRLRRPQAPAGTAEGEGTPADPMEQVD